MARKKLRFGKKPSAGPDSRGPSSVAPTHVERVEGKKMKSVSKLAPEREGNSFFFFSELNSNDWAQHQVLSHIASVGCWNEEEFGANYHLGDSISFTRKG